MVLAVALGLPVGAGAADDRAAAESCPAGNLALRATARIEPGGADAARLVDGLSAREGASHTDPRAVALASAAEAIVLDLGSEARIAALRLQADDNDVYRVEGSRDGERFAPLWIAPPSPNGPGLRTRERRLEDTPVARFLRLRPAWGDAHYAVAELEVFCQPPAGFPAPASVAPDRALRQQRMDATKGTLAVLGALLLTWSASLPRDASRRRRRLRDALLLLLGLAAGAAWWNLGRFHFDKLTHPWEFYHYFLGARYFPELSYTRLYACSVAADVAFSGEESGRRLIRDLEDNRIVPSDDLLAHPERCTAHFEPDRWQAFERDAAFFRGQLGPRRWSEAQRDHGFNATPLWITTARGAVGDEPATPERVRNLALLDVALLAAMWAVIVWAFGWRAACVCALFWGTNFAARYWWTGGGFLRQDWLFLSLLAIALARKGWPVAAGGALAWAALVRVIPVLLLVPVGLQLLWRIREHGLAGATGESGRLLAGFAVGTIALASVGALGAGGPTAWPDFVENTRKHAATPLTNDVGLPVVLSFAVETRAAVTKTDAADDPYAAWKRARAQTFGERRILFATLLVGFALLTALAVRRGLVWEALVLGVGWIPFAIDVACYYYAVLLAFGLLGERRPWIGVALCIVAALSSVAPVLWTWYDEIFAAISVSVLAFVVLVTASHARAGSRNEDGPAALPCDRPVG